MEISRRAGAALNLRNKGIKASVKGGNEGRKVLDVLSNNLVTKGDIGNLNPVKAVRRLRSTESVKEKSCEAVKKAEFKNVDKTPVEEIDVSSLADEIYSVKLLPSNVDDIDSDDSSNPQLVSEYINDIYRYMWSLESKYVIRKNHLGNQNEITGKMRSILVDWLVQVHLRFHLLPETLYLTVSLLDRFLQAQDVRRSKLQLVGVTAMFIASKYEEIYAPELRDFVYITDNAYTKAEILRTEVFMLRKLDFNLSKPLPLHFLRRNSKAAKINIRTHTLAKYLMEVMLPEYEFAQYSPSIMAAAASYLSMTLLDDKSTWDATIAFYSNHEEKDFLPVVRGLCQILLKTKERKLQAITTKYASAKLMEISTIPELKSDIVLNLASEAQETK